MVGFTSGRYKSVPSFRALGCDKGKQSADVVRAGLPSVLADLEGLGVLHSLSFFRAVEFN